MGHHLSTRVALSCSGLVAFLLAGCGDPTQPAATLPRTTFDYRMLPRQVSQLDLGLWVRQWNFDVEGELAVAAEYSRGTIIDFSDRTDPRIVDEWQRNKRIRGVALQDSLLLVLDDSLHVLSVSAPEAEPLAVLGFAASEEPYFVQALAGVLWVATERPTSDALYRIEIRDGASPITTCDVPISGSVESVALENNTLLVGTTTGTVFLDVTDPDRMDTIVTISKGGAVAVANGYAYVGGSSFGNRGMTVLDIRDPTHPIEVGSTLTPYSASKLQIVGHLVFANAGQSVDVVDMVDRRRPVVLGNIPAENRSTGTWFEARGNRLWVVGTQFREFEFEETFSAPLLSDRGVYGCWGCFAQVVDDRLYWYNHGEIRCLPVSGADISGAIQGTPFSRTYELGIQAVHRGHVVATRGNSVEISALDTGELKWSLDLEDVAVWAGIEDDRLFVITRDLIPSSYRIRAFDIGNLRRPRQLSSIRREGAPYAHVMEAVVDDGRVYVLVDVGSGASIMLDIAGFETATAPRFLSQTPLADLERYTTASMIVDQDRVYVDGSAQIVLDARDPTSPRITSRQPGSYALDLVSDGRNLYSATPDRLNLYDLSNPDRPKLIAVQGWVSTNRCIRLLTNSQVLIALQENGIHVYPLHAPAR